MIHLKTANISFVETSIPSDLLPACFLSGGLKHVTGAIHSYNEVTPLG
jgi:hypothetical protein